MTITLEIPLDVEKQIREQAVRGNVDAVRNLLIAALTPTVDELVRRYAFVKPSDVEYEMLIDQLANLFEGYVGPDYPPMSDYAAGREGLYEDHL